MGTRHSYKGKQDTYPWNMLSGGEVGFEDFASGKAKVIIRDFGFVLRDLRSFTKLYG